MKRRHIVIAVALAGLLSGCTSVFTGGVGTSQLGDRAADRVPAGSDPTDSVIGLREHPKIVATYGGVYNNRSAEIMLARMAGKLLVAAEQPNQSLTVTILDSPEVNAFALPGGYIYVTRGILALASDEAELAAVLSHEIAHLTLRHARERSNRERTSKIVDRVISGILGADPDTDQSLARSKLSLAAFSQSQELAADRRGVLVAGAAGYDPHAAARFLSQMGRFAAFTEGDDSGDDFLSSHPSTPSRIEEAVKSARQLGAPGIGATERERYQRAIDGLAFGPNPDNGTIVGQQFIYPALKFTFSVPKAYQLSNGAASVVAVAESGTALRFDSANVPSDLPLDVYLRSGWVAGLNDDSVRTGQRNGVERVTATATTEKWFFRIAVVRYDGQVYRFIFAAERDSKVFRQEFEQTIDSFRPVQASDLKQIQNFEVDIVTAKAGQRAGDLSRMMAGVKRRDDLFLILNGLYPGDPLVAGQGYKIIRPDK